VALCPESSKLLLEELKLVSLIKIYETFVFVPEDLGMRILRLYPLMPPPW
jgi:hypothetical protein